ncbi:Protein STB6 [Leucoagaricus sp. SymC.cos]|nr:Protein STB6 [Leucoagaricus sp. SymC.cos]
MYAVEKWIVERNRPITVLTVYTGDPSHKITVTALAPSSSLSEKDAATQWEQALLHLRRDASARPKQTPAGVVMATSLAYFRSDYTIVHIPHGNFLLAKDQLYANINLLRMGCGGRSALTLGEPSDSTKDRFMSTYHVPEITQPSSLPLPLHHNPTSSDHLPLLPMSKAGNSRPSIHVIGPTPTSSVVALLSTHTRGKTKDLPFFNATVLELVKLVQVGLSLFGMYDVREGTGCERWIAEIGEPRAGLEPAERIADPMFLSALLSLVLSIRNKLSALGHSNAIPKDPFLHPYAFLAALSSYVSSTSHSSGFLPQSSPIPPSIPSHAGSGPQYLSLSPLSVTVTTAPFAAAAILNPHPPSSFISPQSSTNATQLHLAGSSVIALTRELVDSIESAYAKRVVSGSASASNVLPRPKSRTRRRVKRAIKGKLEDITSAVATATSTDHDFLHDTIDDDRIGRDDHLERGDRGDRGGTLSGGEADGNMSVGSGGHQLLRGVGNLILSGASGIAGTNGSGHHTCIYEVIVDLERFVGSILEKDGSGSSRRLGVRGRKKKGPSESVDFGRGGAGGGSGGTSGGEYGVVVSMLWSGRVADVVALREWEKERERVDMSLGSASGFNGGVGSDGEEARSEGIGGRSTEGEDSDLQMEGRLGGGSFGERVQRKLGSWTGLSKRRGHTLGGNDFTAGSGSIGSSKAVAGDGTPAAAVSKGSAHAKLSRAQSPTLHSGPLSGDLEQDDMLDSGQVSPSSDYRHNLFALEERNLQPKGSGSTKLYDISRGVSTAELGREKGKGKAKVKAERPGVGGANIALDGTREDSEEPLDDDAGDMREGEEGEEEESVEVGERGVEGDVDGKRRKMKMLGVRRRSYHDLDSLRSIKVLSPERMKIDVELCAQVLIMVRREEHLRNVIACLEVISYSALEGRVLQADSITQATNTLQYESAQFSISEVWHTASLSRKKVFELREKVFGTGGRRLPSGKHGAHGRFNRVQWTLDGNRRLVDYLGRTEDEAEEENRVKVPGVAVHPPPPDDEEEEVVEHAGMKPMWLLRFFTTWGARWSALRVGGGHHTAAQDSSSGPATASALASGSGTAEAAEKVDRED